MSASKTYIVCWDEVFDNTVQIEAELAAGGFSYLIINKSRFLKQDNNWIKAKDTRYYGHFLTALEDFVDKKEHSVFVFHAGDCRWPAMSSYTKKLEDIFKNNLHVGVVAPDQTNDPFTGEGSFIEESALISELAVSTMTNGIFIAVTREIAEIIYKYMTWAINNGVDFYSMTSGWGLDYTYCGVAVYLNKCVYKDTSLTMFHPTGSGYNYKIANDEFNLIIKSFLKFWEVEGYDAKTMGRIFDLFMEKVQHKSEFQLKLEDLYLNADSKPIF